MATDCTSSQASVEVQGQTSSRPHGCLPFDMPIVALMVTLVNANIYTVSVLQGNLGNTSASVQI
jgi:hypothetical protein